MIARQIGPYRIEEKLGEGGMGEVYRATDTRLGRQVAIKVMSARLSDDPAARARFEREARAVAALSHPHILALYEFGESEGAPYAVTELLAGESLAERLAGGPLPADQALDIATAIADGLAFAHAAGVVHRDLKPANVFITRDNRVKILDFGLAQHSRIAGGSTTATIPFPQTAPDHAWGTAGYMAPEQLNGEESDARADVFSLGCVLHEMITGRPVFDASTPAARIAAVLRDQPRCLSGLPGVSPQLAALVERCLEKDPVARFQSAADLLFALREAARSAGYDRAPARRTIAVAAAIAVVALCALVWAVMYRSGAPATPGSVEGSSGARTVARDAYIRGERALEKRTEADLKVAAALFQTSIDADPTYAEAYVGLAQTYGQLGYGSFVSPEASFALCRSAAEKAIALNPALAAAHATRGFALMYYDWSFDAAEREYREAIRLTPADPAAHQWYAYLLTAMERPEQDAMREIDEARRLDPLSIPINIDRAYILHYYQRNDAALAAVQDALDMNPSFPPAFFWLGRIYTSLGRYAEAEEALRHIGPLRTWTPAMATLGYLYGRMGRTSDARAVLQEFDALVRQGRYATSYAIAVVHAGLGDRERALATLETAVKERTHWLVWLKRDPRWDDIRADPRFAAIVRHVGLPASGSDRGQTGVRR